MRKLLVAIVMGCFLSCANVKEQQPSFKLDQVHTDRCDTYMDSIASVHELMGTVIYLTKDTQIIYQYHSGMADLEKSILVSDQTKFRIASISKTVVAIAVMQLVELDLIDLDADVSNYLGWSLRNPAHVDDSITLRQLMSHQSSIRDGKGYAAFSEEMRSKSVHIRELFSPNGKYFSADMFAEHSPGEYFSYTNSIWGLIASIVEIASGERFDIYCQNHIFYPLQMGASFNVNTLRGLEYLAVLYRFMDSTWIPQLDNYEGKVPLSPIPVSYRFGQNGLLFGPQGGLRCSGLDLTRLIYLFIGNGKYQGRKILNPESINMMVDNQWMFNGENGDTWDQFFLSYGLGIHRVTNTDKSDIIFPDRHMKGHPGIAYGLLSDMYFHRNSGIGVVFITNGSKQEYAYGRNSTFYQVEEDIFQGLYPIVKLVH